MVLRQIRCGDLPLGSDINSRYDKVSIWTNNFSWRKMLPHQKLIPGKFTSQAEEGMHLYRSPIPSEVINFFHIKYTNLTAVEQKKHNDFPIVHKG